MPRTILVGLDGSDDARPALELGLEWAAAYKALLIGCAVIDEAGVRASEVALLGESFVAVDDEMLVSQVRSAADQSIDEFSKRVEAQGVRGRAVVATGVPHEQLVAEAHRADVVLLGRLTHFEFGHATTSDSTLNRVIQESPRPVVVVPRVPTRPVDGPVVVAFDGSVRSSRALYDFVASGLGVGRAIHVLTVDRDPDVARTYADRATEFLQAHELQTVSHPFDGEFPAIEAILGVTQELDAALLVVGAFGHSALHEWLHGSKTRSLFEHAEMPVFCTH